MLSALLCAGIAALALTGIFANYDGIAAGESAQIFIFVAIFLTLFLIIFFCFNLRRHSADLMPAEAVQVESVTGLGGSFFMFRQPFAFSPGSPELLQGAENQETGVPGEVVYEKNGIHYINNNVFVDDKSEEQFDRNFAKLVESVVNNEEFELT